MKTLKFFIISIAFVLSLATGVSAEFFTDVIVTSTNGIWTDSRAYSSLTAAVNAVGTTLQRTIVISSQQSVGNITIPSNITLKFERDGAIINSGQLTLNTRNIIADNRQIFAGGGDIDFVSGTKVKTGWFSTFETAVSMTSDDTVTLVVTKAQTLTTSQAFGNNVSLEWETPGNILTANTGITISNIGQVVAGNYQTFAGAGNFRFRDGTVLNLSWFANLRAAITHASTNKLTLFIKGTHTVDFSDTAPSTITFKFFQGGIVSVSPGVTLTLGDFKMIDIGSYNHDPFTGTGSVAFSGGLTYTPASGLTAAVLKSLLGLGSSYEVDALYTYGGGSSYTSATINSAITSIGATTATLLIRPGAWAITTNVTVPTNINLKVVNGAIMTIAAATTLTINGPLEAGLYQVFSGDGNVRLIGGSVISTRPEWWHEAGTSWHTAIQKALDCNLSYGVTVEFAQGTYYYMTEGVRINYDNVHLRGQGRTATKITFLPAGADETAITFAASTVTGGLGEDEVPTAASVAASLISYNSIKGMTIESGANTETKTAIKIVGAGQFLLDDVTIYPWLGTRSIGLHTKGHEFNRFSNLFITADLPILIDVGPTVALPSSAIDADHFNFHNLYLSSLTTYPCVLINAYAWLTNISFTGAQAWVGGTAGYGLQQTVTGFTDTTRTGMNQNFSISNLRTEGAADATAYSISFEKMDQVAIKNAFLDSGRKGVYYRYSSGAPSLLLDGINYAGALEAINVTNTERRVEWHNSFIQSTASISMGTLPKRFAIYTLGYAVPTTAIYASDQVAAGYVLPLSNGTALQGEHRYTGTITLAAGASSDFFAVNAGDYIKATVIGYDATGKVIEGGEVIDYTTTEATVQPILLSGTANFVVTDTNAKLCFLRTAGTATRFFIKNRLTNEIIVKVAVSVFKN